MNLLTKIYYFEYTIKNSNKIINKLFLTILVIPYNKNSILLATRVPNYFTLIFEKKKN